MGKQLNVQNSEITAKDDALFFNAMIAKNGVWQFGHKLDYEIVSANQIKIKDGMVTAQGRNYVIYPNEVDTLTITNGVSGSKRNDLIVYEVSKANGVEALSLKVIKGTQATNPVDPTITQDDTLVSGTVYQMPLYRVRVNGITIEGVDDLREYISSFGDVSQPNILVNGDFNVNSKGKTSYYGHEVYSVDKWKLVNGLNLTVSDNSILLQSPSDLSFTGRLKQILNGLQSGIYTLSMKVVNCTSDVPITNFGTIPQGFSGIYTNTSIEHTPTSLEMFIPIGESLEIEWIQLHKGTVAFEHIKEDYATAVARCHPITYGTELPTTLEDGDIFFLIKE